MSELTDRVDGALCSEWRTTREIAELAGDGRARYSSNILRHLLSLERFGLAERRKSVREYGGRATEVSEWRLRP